MRTYRLGHKEAGLTLIELLVTVVILSFTVALMSGAFNQISQILRVSSEQSNGFPARWIQSRAIYELIGNMVIDPTREKAFRGDYQSIEMVSLAVPEEQQGVAHPVKLTLKGSKNSEQISDLMLMPSTAFGSEQAQPLKLASFEGRLEFVFVDHLLAEHAQWPPNGMTDSRPMPSAILLRATDGKRTLMRMAAYEGNLSPPNQAISKAFGPEAQ
jgi:prepilin-type N-terminal cleavage/methylation domain-containing protein